MENHIQQQKDHEEDDRQDYLQTLFRAQFEFVFAGPLEAVARWQDEFLPQKLAGFVNEPAVVSGVEIEVNVPRERGIFVPNHRGAFGKGDLGEFAQWNLSVRRRRDYDTLELLQVIPKIRRVADIDRIAFA